MIDKHVRVQQYVADVCRQVKARELHKEIRQELSSHFDELMDEAQEQGMDGEAAARWAIARMGDPAEVAAGLNKVHKPKIPWAIMSCLALLVSVALVMMYAVELSYAAGPRSYLEGAGLFSKQAGYMAAGLVLLFVLSRIHYRKLLDFSLVLYAAKVLLMLGAILWGPQMNGMSGYIRIGPFSVDVMNASPYALVVSAAGMLRRRDNTARSACAHAVLFAVVPSLLYILAPSFSALMMYTCASLLLLYAAGRRRWMLAQLPLFMLAGGGCVAFSRAGKERLAAFFHRHEAAADAGYMYVQIDEAIRSAGWWGQGFAAVSRKLPFIHSDTVFTYTIYSMGWLAGAIVAICVLLFVAQLARAGALVRDPHGKMLISGLSALFAFQFVWSIGMSLGLLPMVSMSFPFFSYGGSQLLVQLAAVGMIYSVYRRKDMVRIV